MAGGVALLVDDLVGLFAVDNFVVFWELLMYHAVSVAQQGEDFKYYTLAKVQKI